AYALLLTGPSFRVRALVLGRGRTAETISKLLADPARHDYELVATIDYRSELRADHTWGAQLRALVAEHEVGEIVVDSNAFRAAGLGPALVELDGRGVRIRTDWVMYESLTGRVLLPLADPSGLGTTGAYQLVYGAAQHLVEVLVALIGLAVLAPL